MTQSTTDEIRAKGHAEMMVFAKAHDWPALGRYFDRRPWTNEKSFIADSGRSIPYSTRKFLEAEGIEAPPDGAPEWEHQP